MIKTKFISQILASALLLSVFVSFGAMLKPHASLAQGCTSAGQCVDGRRCEWSGEDGSGYLEATGAPCKESLVGNVNAPAGIVTYNNSVSQNNANNADDPIGIILFLSNIINLFAIVAGIFAMFNFVIAGYMFISAGADPGAMEKVRERLMWTVVGLAIIAASYTLAGLIGAIFFGDAGFILEPAFYSVLE